MSSPSRVLVLAEDQRQKQFIRRFLIRAGIGPHQMAIEASPSGHGSAEQWVRENFARQAEKCRVRNARAATGMFVMLDADTKTVKECLELLDDALTGAGQRPIDEDPIARLIPKRNVETWILWLSANGAGTPIVDEDQDYKRTRTNDEWSEMIPSAAEALFKWTRDRNTTPLSLIDSLRRGLEEIPRALPMGR